MAMTPSTSPPCPTMGAVWKATSASPPACSVSRVSKPVTASPAMLRSSTARVRSRSAAGSRESRSAPRAPSAVKPVSRAMARLNTSTWCWRLVTTMRALAFSSSSSR